MPIFFTSMSSTLSAAKAEIGEYAARKAAYFAGCIHLFDIISYK